jgi:histidinol-phosphate phosphatase family protein
VDGFDERFPRAYREDADVGLRLTERGWRIVRGERVVEHPVRPADRWMSVRLQAGNADDALMRALHGRRWRQRAGVPAGRRPRHLAVAAAGVSAAGGVLAGRRRAAALAAAVWVAGTGELAWARIAPGPRSTAEVATMVATSAALPLAAAGHWLHGCWRVWRRGWTPARRPAPRAVLFDRDGTLVEDVPYNGDPARVRLRAGAREAVEQLRRAGVPMAIVTNQSGIGRGRLTRGQVDAVNARVQELLGVRLPCHVCPHAPADGCACRKPGSALVVAACADLGVAPEHAALVGDIGADVEAARAAGCRAVLVPTPATRAEEIRAAPAVAATLPAAVALLMGGSA